MLQEIQIIDFLFFSHQQVAKNTLLVVLAYPSHLNSLNHRVQKKKFQPAFKFDFLDLVSEPVESERLQASRQAGQPQCRPTFADNLEGFADDSSNPRSSHIHQKLQHQERRVHFLLKEADPTGKL